MRIVIGISYKGTNFYGFQKQKKLPTIEEWVTKSIAQVADHKIDLIASGRTDRGVHAVEQIAHFDTYTKRELQAWIKGVNSYLPKDISILWAQPIDDDFHARFSAVSRYYRYIILNQKERPALGCEYYLYHQAPLNIDKMQEAANYLLGEHNFTTFRSCKCQAKNPQRIMHKINIHTQECFIYIDLYANSFLHHMARNIVGALIMVGEKKRPSKWIDTILKMKDRTKAAFTAKACGLYLMRIEYPNRFTEKLKREKIAKSFTIKNLIS